MRHCFDLTVVGRRRTVYTGLMCGNVNISRNKTTINGVYIMVVCIYGTEDGNAKMKYSTTVPLDTVVCCSYARWLAPSSSEIDLKLTYRQSVPAEL